MPLSTKAEALLTEFQHQPGVTKDQVDNLRKAINASPVLVAQVNSAVAAGHLKHFAVLPAGTHAGGSYEAGTHTMNLPLSMLTTPANGGSVNLGEIAFVLGHEVQHSFNRAATQKAYTTFEAEVAKIAQSATPVHDYTGAVAKLIAANRNDEARAEIAGFNAIVSLARAKNPKATFDDIYNLQPGRMGDFLHWDNSAKPPGYRPYPDLHLNADMTMPATAANIQAMGKHYFDKPGAVAHLGHNGNSDYTNYYGAYAISFIAQFEHAFAKPVHGAAPRIMLDMKRLHLSESMLEQNGITLAGDKPLPYYDSSSKPPKLHHFNHTEDTHKYTPIRSEGVGAVPPVDPTHVAHPGHGLYRQIAEAVARLDARFGRVPDAISQQVSANLYAAARDAGLTAVTHVVPNVETGTQRPGERLFAVQGAMDDPLRRVAWIDTAEALRTPSVDAFRRVERVEAAIDAAQPPPVPGRWQACAITQR